MAKRLTDTAIWKSQRWFRKLQPIYKLAFCYIKDQSDHAGLWKIDCSDLMEDLCIEEFDIYDFVSSINTEYDKISGGKIIKERVLIIQNSVLWITGFVQFQYERKGKYVEYNCNATKSALIILHSTKFNPFKPLEAPLSPQEELTLLEYGISVSHIKVKDDISIFLKGLQALIDKDKDKDKLVKQEKNGYEKQFSNFTAQGEELFAARDKRHRAKLK